MKKPSMTTVLRKVRAAHRKPATNAVSGPTFFEIADRPAPVYFVDPETGDFITLNLKTATFKEAA